MKIATQKRSVKLGTIPQGACRVRSVNKEIVAGDVVWVQKTPWNPWIKCRVYQVIEDWALKVLYYGDDTTWVDR